MVDDNSTKQFAGATRYVLDQELAKIVNISMALEMPLLLKGEPGTGKTLLAHAVAEDMGLELITWNINFNLLISPHVSFIFYLFF